MSSAEAAATGFSFMDCSWFITGDNSGIQLFIRGDSQPVWHSDSPATDSIGVRAAAAGFREYAEAEFN